MTPLVRLAARHWGFLDRPNERSSHRRIVPRGGGVAILAAVGLSLALARGSWPGSSAAVALLAGMLVLAALGLCDDRFSLSPALRLAVHLAVAAGFVSVAGSIDRVPLPPPLDASLGPAGSVVSVLWIVAVVNFYNFMDGIDGLASLQAIVTGAGIALAGFDPFASLLGAALAGAAAGFLVFNWSPASIFLGDVGSGAMGFCLAALPSLAAPAARPSMVLFVALSLWLFLSDATWTLLRRMARGERLHQAHREHLYQRLVSSGWSHARVSGGLGLAAAVLTAAALFALPSRQPPVRWLPVLLALLVFSAEVTLVVHREGRRS
ncbi:MAG TPA: glycosyltransferase family 4 protein [Vicinamibacteria bacterium]|nr:glycosyltransferase family 4 protein [Vicinamibacteria bacterium]